eukprot:2745695-Rhodomonas_salina.1
MPNQHTEVRTCTLVFQTACAWTVPAYTGTRTRLDPPLPARLPFRPLHSTRRPAPPNPTHHAPPSLYTSSHQKKPEPETARQRDGETHLVVGNPGRRGRDVR